MVAALPFLWALPAYAQLRSFPAAPVVPEKLISSSTGSYINNNSFSYDGLALVDVGNLIGHDNIEGNFVAQDYSETAATGSGTCTAPDGTAGSNYPFVEDFQINTYPSGDQMIWFFGTGSPVCTSNTTGSFGGTENGTIVGGSGKFANASGPIHESYTGVTISSPASPGSGYIYIDQNTVTGSLTP